MPHHSMQIFRLRKFLLDEEGSQVRELPRAGGAQDDELDDHPPHDAGVGGLGLVSELGFPLLFRCFVFVSAINIHPEGSGKAKMTE